MKTVTREYYESIGLGEAYAQQVAREAMEEHAWRKGERRVGRSPLVWLGGTCGAVLVQMDLVNNF